MIVEVIRANITDEERQKRIRQIERIAGSMVREIYEKESKSKIMANNQAKE